MAYFNCLHKLLPMEIEASGKRTASGTVVSLTDVSPVEHEMKVKVAPKNLISYPYDETTKTEGGYTFTDNGDGSVTVSGTNTTDSAVEFYFTHALELPAGDYVLSTDGGAVENCRIIYAGSSFIELPLGDETVHVTLTQAETVLVLINVFACAVDNLTLTPKIQAAAPSATTLTRYGKNLFDSATFEAKLKNWEFVEFEGRRCIKNTPNKDCILTGYMRMDFPVPVKSLRYDAYCAEPGKMATIFSLLNEAGKTTHYTYTSNDINNWTINFTKGVIYGFKLLCNSPYDVYIDLDSIMATAENDNLPYEPSVIQTYPVNEDGTVDGVMSILPVTNMLTDTDDVINVEYMNSLCIKIDGNFIKMKASL